MKIMLFGLCVLAMPIVFATMPSADAECMQVFRQTRETMGSTNLAPLQSVVVAENAVHNEIMARRWSEKAERLALAIKDRYYDSDRGCLAVRICLAWSGHSAKGRVEQCRALRLEICTVS